MVVLERVGDVPNTSAPVPVSSVMSDASFAEVFNDDDAIRPLNDVQSDAVKRPRASGDALGSWNVWIPLLEEILKSVPAVDDANVCVELSWPLSEVSPLPDPARPSVEVATQRVDVPEVRRIIPFVPMLFVLS